VYDCKECCADVTDVIKEVWCYSPLLQSEQLWWGALVKKEIHCEGDSMGTFADLVNGSMQKYCSSQNLHHTYGSGLVDSVMGRLSWVHTLCRPRA
jgi:hypothetical protein